MFPSTGTVRAKEGTPSQKNKSPVSTTTAPTFLETSASHSPLSSTPEPDEPSNGSDTQLDIEPQVRPTLECIPRELSLLTPESRPRNGPNKHLINHFHTHVYKSLHPVIQDAITELWHHPQLQTAVLALSACNLFNLHSFQRGSLENGQHINKTHSTATKAYLRYALGFYDEAVSKVRQMQANPGSSTLELQHLNLGATLLLALFEWDLGSVKACFAHLDGADAIVLSSHTSLAETDLGSRLLRSWAEMHAQKYRRRLPFRPLHGESAKDQCMQAAVLSQRNCRTVELSILLTEAYRTRNRVVLQECMGLETTNSEAALRMSRAWYSQAFEFSYETDPDTEAQTTLTTDEMLDRLETTNRSLQKWHSLLPLVELPSPSHAINVISFQTAHMKFVNHVASCQYLHYLMASMLSSLEILDMFLFRACPPLPDEPFTAQVISILALIEALDPEIVATQHTFHVGPIWVFYTLPLCVPDFRITTYLLDTILPRFERYVSCGPLLRSLAQTRQSILGIQSQILLGRLPLLYDANVLTTEDLALSDRARRGTKAAVFGRDFAGRRFQEIVELPSCSL
ncbi:hypothetical protein BKA56DRAFT_597278 [Ilyonectria sp. MPI-CAGE-AT-0026]|nr:hypothetical protein BKA56DRAFT_597278 [Ilyonectria sp. MPI-CAGE-AT-0026]